MHIQLMHFPTPVGPVAQLWHCYEVENMSKPIINNNATESLQLLQEKTMDTYLMKNDEQMQDERAQPQY